MLDINGCPISIGCVSKNPLGDPDPVFVSGFMDKEDVIIETLSGNFYQVHQSHIEVMQYIQLTNRNNKKFP